MDWHLAIERNGEALKRILAMLVAMAGLADGSRTHLPRGVHRACLRLLRPAEAAARRLVIVAARGVIVTLAPVRPRAQARTRRSAFIRDGRGTGIVLPAVDRLGSRPLPGASSARKPVTRLALPLLDTLPRLAPRRPRTVPARGAPRIVSLHGAAFGVAAPVAAPSALRRPPRPDDPIAAARLRLRLDALGRALDDLPGEARRFARWRARIEAARNLPPGPSPRCRRLTPLRPGRPPGAPRKPTLEVHEVLADLNVFAIRALERQDTS